MREQLVAAPPDPVGAWRVGDRDRDDAVEALGEHYASGRLDKQEYDERADLAYAARTDRDLARLFADLPLPRPAPADLPAVVPAAPSDADRRPPRRHPRGHLQRHHRHHRGPFGPWLLVVVPVVILTGAYWLLWLVPVLLWCVVRPARRFAARGPVSRA